MTEMNIPSELRQDNSWVCVKNASKVPYNCSSFRYASPSDPNTWNSFEMALNQVYSGKFDGLGYCFHDNGIVGIDIDAGFDEEGFLSDLAVDIMKHCESYTEISRSGRGVHILVKGMLPFNGANNRAGVEIYKTGRYFIMTGKKIVYGEIRENQKALDYIVENYFPQERESENVRKETFYKPVTEVKNGKVVVTYPEIPDGCRNQSLTSYAGQLKNKNYTREQIFSELCRINKIACKPPLDEMEIKNIVKSVMRYKNDKL